MLIDLVRASASYLPIHPRFREAFAFLQSEGVGHLPPGRHEIDGDRIYATVMHAEGKRQEEAMLEAHRRYVDIQYLIEGTETMGWKPLSVCTARSSPYDEERDCEFFSDVPASWITLSPGMFALFFPDDAHAPMVSGGFIHKIVVKVKI